MSASKQGNCEGRDEAIEHMRATIRRLVKELAKARAEYRP